MPIIISLLVFSLLSYLQVSGQATYPQNYFRLPIDFTPSLSGTFAEIRSGHFHSGIDFRTGGVEGKPLYAAADGFVSRIRISPEGFGKAIYIEHPNGYSTVYAHIKNFVLHIQQYIINEQYKQESFDVNLFPPPNSIPVKKGEVIGWSGNSGSSGGPHLHFEIRHTGSQKPINPKMFGLKIKDDIPPVIQSLKVYPANRYSSINDQSQPLVFNVKGQNGNYAPDSPHPLNISGDVFFGLHAYDKQNHSNFRNGIAAMSIFVDGELTFSYRIDEFSFSETRFVNAVIDYEEFATSKRRFIQTRILPNNPLDIYPVANNGGIFTFNEKEKHSVRIVLEDAAGNEAALQLQVNSKPPSTKPVQNDDVENKIYFRFDQTNRFQNSEMIIEMPAYALYDNLWFRFAEEAPDENTITGIFHVHDINTPVHLNYLIAIKTDIPEQHLQSKAIVVRKDDDGEWVSEAGEYIDGFVTTSVRNFGAFSIMLDTVSPVIMPLNIADNKNIGGQQNIRIEVSDELSGINTYRGTMNGKWILMDYDPKNDLLIYQIDDRTIEGQNHFRLTVKDQAGNQAVYEASVIL
jgi:hypothetical protein